VGHDVGGRAVPEGWLVKGRWFLAYALFVSLVEQAVLLFVLLRLLPSAGLRVPLWVTVTLAALLAGYSVVLTRINMRTLDRKPLRSPDVGAQGRVVSPLAPRGYVRVGNELWVAVSEGPPIAEGEEVAVVRVEGLRLFVVPVGDEQPES
jgi:membrane-bound ClpP family serine protease